MPIRRETSLAQLLDVLALLADHHARTGGVDGDARVLGRALDLDAAHRGLRQARLQELAHLQVGIEVVREILGIGVPLGIPVLDDAEADAGRMYFLTHGIGSLPLPSATVTVMWLVRLTDAVARPLARA
jgi:hypothetical protein